MCVARTAFSVRHDGHVGGIGSPAALVGLVEDGEEAWHVRPVDSSRIDGLAWPFLFLERASYVWNTRHIGFGLLCKYVEGTSVFRLLWSMEITAAFLT